MKFPINVSRRPFREKYLQEEPQLRRWFIFGETGDTVDIADSEGDVLIRVPKDAAQEIIEARDRFLDAMFDLLIE